MSACPCLRRLGAFGAVLLCFATLLPAKPVAPAGVTVAGKPMTSVEVVAAPPPDPDSIPLGAPQFDTTPTPLPPNLPGLGFEATATSEFGDHVRLSGAAHFIDTVTVTMSSAALRSAHPGSSSLGFTHPITLRLYSVDRSAGTPRTGDVLATITQAFLIPWRPEPDPTVALAGRPWRARDGNYYTGLAFNLTFDLGALGGALPDEVIFGISFNTASHGSAPLGISGAYDFLHVGVTDRSATPGTDVEANAAFWKTNTPALYTDNGLAGVNVFRHDAGWMPYRPAVRFTNSAYGMIAETAASLRILRSTDARHEAVLRDSAALVTQTLSRGLWDGNNRLSPDFGRVVFNLISEAAGQLAAIDAGQDAVAAVELQTASRSLLRVSEMLAETALGDAIIAGGNARRISRAQGALDDAYENEGNAHVFAAVDAYAQAWRDAQLALMR